jgi:Fe-S cluster assembly protein SufD
VFGIKITAYKDTPFLHLRLVWTRKKHTSIMLSPDPATLATTPSWFRARAEAAWKTYESLPLPSTKNEAWRYSNAEVIPLDRLQAARKPSPSQLEQALKYSDSLPEVAAKFVFVNDHLALADLKSVPDQVILMPLADALDTHSELVAEHFMQQESQLGSAKFAALHLAMVKAGMVIFVPRGVEIPAPVEVFYWVSGTDSALFPHTLIITEEQSSVKVVDHYRSLGDETGFCCSVADLVAGTGGKITYVACQEMSASAHAMQLSSTQAGKDAHVKSFQLQLGAAWARSESVSELIGSGAHSDMFSISLPLGDQVVDQRTLQNHRAPNATSDLLYKNALHDDSRTVFSGLITVDEGAHFTDAYQTCRNLLNSDTAEANSMPGLEINADQVKCSHGSTTGPVDQAELFYLMARGIPEKEARKLIVMGFADDVIGRIGHEAIEQMIHTRVEEKFARVA